MNGAAPASPQTPSTPADAVLAPAPEAPAAPVRLPVEPYPGLRPFLDFESLLFFGRERQVHEVIQRLAATHFVTVLGGSGSGKSSLVHAGVVPELRSFAIPGTGDTWLPMTCTPGTDTGGGGRPASGDAAGDAVTAGPAAASGGPQGAGTAQTAAAPTPVTRLARRFAALLRPLPDARQAPARIDRIAAVFRQPGGFARLLEAFGAELALPAGPDPAEARVLFVLDQFEEVFHPSNRDVDDARVLVERVLDHFGRPHPRAYVVITMRSEFLNDCAAFLELPDAINKSSYLVRRLDAAELREAIAAPAQRFRLMRARAAGDPRALPARVVVEPAVEERLLRDVASMAHDPDHLPLLQHVLARLWTAALQREGEALAVPSRLTADDLARAVLALPAGPGMPLAAAVLDDDVNTLRECVDRWPEASRQRLPAAQRQALDALLARLAFRDPETGRYTQHRVALDDAVALLGPHATRQDLRELLGVDGDGLGFVGAVDYLFWDDEDPDRQTLKVSHESFVRGWGRFRSLVDAEAARFDEFVGVLRRCAQWRANARGEDFLLRGAELRRLAEGGFQQRLSDAGERARWQRLLGQLRDGAALAPADADVERFFHEAQQREARERQRRRRARLWLWAAVALAVSGSLLPLALFSLFVQAPTMRRGEQLLEAGNRVNRVRVDGEQSDAGDGAPALASVLHAAALVEQARTGSESPRQSASQRLLDSFGRWPPFAGQREYLELALLRAEPPVNALLRELLQQRLWRASAAAAADGPPLPPPRRIDDAVCTVASGAPLTAEAPRGRLFVQAARTAVAGDDPRALRAVFVPARPSFDRRLEIFGASVDAAGACVLLDPPVLASPEALDSRVVFDAALRYFAYTADDAESGRARTLVVQLDWERGGDGQLSTWLRHSVTTLTDPGAAAAVRRAAGADRAAAVPTWRAEGGRVIEVDGRRWRLVSRQAQRVAPAADGDAPASAADPPGTVALAPSAEGSDCARLAATAPAEPGFAVDVFEDARWCLRIARGWPSAVRRPQRDEVAAAVYRRPSAAVLERLASSPPAPLAVLPVFARVAPADAAPAGGRWRIGVEGPWDGWLLMRTRDGAGAARWIGLPWSTCALWRMGRDVARDQPATAASAATAVGGIADAPEARPPEDCATPAAHAEPTRGAPAGGGG